MASAGPVGSIRPQALVPAPRLSRASSFSSVAHARAAYYQTPHGSALAQAAPAPTAPPATLAAPAAPLPAALRHQAGPPCETAAWEPTDDGLRAALDCFRRRVAAGGLQANAGLADNTELSAFLVRSVDPRRQAPLELLRLAQLVYAIGATVPFGRGSAMNAAVSHASVALDRALFATVGAFEGMLCPVEDFPLTLEEIVMLMEQCVCMRILPPKSTFARMLNIYVDRGNAGIQVVLRLFAVWLATNAEHGCMGCPTIMLYKSALRTLLPALHMLPAADLRMLVACQHAVTGPFGNSVVYQSLLPHICKAAVLGMHAGRLSRCEASEVAEAAVEAAGAVYAPRGASLQSSLDTWMVEEALRAPAAENNIAAWEHTRHIANLLSMAVVFAASAALGRAA